MTILRGLLVAALVAVGGPAAAQNPQMLLAARAAGQVGERYDGYLGAPGAVGRIVRMQLDSVNIQRRSLFTNFAARKAVSPGDVGITAGCTLLGRVAVGEVYLLSDNVWRRRGPGEAAPRPDYCTGG